MAKSDLKNDPASLSLADARRLGLAPAAAMRFGAGEFTLGTNGENAKTAPIKILARTGQPLYHWWWGRCVHDMAGMTVHKSRLALDYCHSDFDIIGYLNKFDTTGGDLNVSGAVVPYKDNDRASEVLFKARAGVPYEASIDFTPGDAALVIEDVPAGRKVAVNGYDFEGPGMVFRQWPLRGVAVCPYGADMNARSEFARGAENVPVTFINGKETQMTNPQEAEAAKAAVDAGTAVKPEAAQAAVEGEKAAEKKAAEEKAAADKVAEEKAAADKAAEEKAAADNAAEAAAQARSECQKFVEAFGAKGGEWFAAGKTFDEAQALHAADLKAENVRLAADNERLAKAARAARGEELPLTFVAEGPGPVPIVSGLAGKIGENAAKVAGAIKFQKKDK